MTVPGIGPIISSAMVAAIGTGDVFSKGRDFGAWLGLVPKQISTGDRTILGSISRRGNRYLRALFVQAAWVVLVKLGANHWERYGLLGSRRRRSDCTTTCSPLRWPISLLASRGRFSTRGAPSRASRPMRWHPVQRDPRAVLGAVKGGLAARKRGARPVRRPPLTAPMRGASARAGRDEGTAARHEQRNSAK
jgi:transposase IS116/IS110/IS902 family protein